LVYLKKFDRLRGDQNNGEYLNMNFPDLPHLRQLQKDLWQWPKSRAAVVVGAGFSLNAEPLDGVNTRFSTWRQLVLAMFDKLHLEQDNLQGFTMRNANCCRNCFQVRKTSGSLKQ